jgi:hypothetical protein
VATAGLCIGVGAAAGIAGSAAAPSKAPSSARSARARAASEPVAAGLTTSAAGPGIAAIKVGIGSSPVHGVEVVPNEAGDGFDTVTEDAGTVKSVSGQELTITEGTAKATYATPTLTIPADADVQRNFAAARLGDIQVGDHVDVNVDSDGTTSVFAVDAQDWPPTPPSVAGCAKSGRLVRLPGGTTGPAGSVAAQSAKLAAAAQAGRPLMSISGATGTTGVTSPAIVKLPVPGGPPAGIVCSVSTTP